LKTFLDTHPNAKFELWTDGNILPGQRWRDEIQDALRRCDFGLLLVSPSFLASNFITTAELPLLLREKRVIPVGLERVLLDGSMDLKGLEERQIFFDSRHKTFGERGTDKKGFALELYKGICGLLGESKKNYEHHLRLAALEGFDEAAWTPTEG